MILEIFAILYTVYVGWITYRRYQVKYWNEDWVAEQLAVLAVGAALCLLLAFIINTIWVGDFTVAFIIIYCILISYWMFERLKAREKFNRFMRRMKS